MEIIRAVSRGQNELIGEFKIAVDVVISIWGRGERRVMKYMYTLRLKGFW